MAPRHVQVLKASRVVEPTWAQRDPFDVFGDFSPPDHPPSPGGYPIWGGAWSVGEVSRRVSGRLFPAWVRGVLGSVSALRSLRKSHAPRLGINLR